MRDYEPDYLLMEDLLEHYVRKGYLTRTQADNLKRLYDPFQTLTGCLYLADGLRRMGHEPHTISHHRVNKGLLLTLFEALGKN